MPPSTDESSSSTFEFRAPPPRKLPAQNPLLEKATFVDASRPEPSSNSSNGAAAPAGQVMQPSTRPGKVPLAPGYSQMRWMQLSRTEDLSGRGGQPLRRDITLAEVKQHNSVDDAWTVLRGKVYNITPYLKFHPGGIDWIMKGAGRDCTALFTKYHAWVNSDMLLQSCLIGMLGTPAP